MKSRMHHTNYRYQPLETFLKHNHQFESKPLEDRCKVFFEDFLEKRPNWLFPEFKNDPYNKDIDKLKDFYTQRTNDLINKKKKKGQEPKVGLKEKRQIMSEFSRIVDSTLKVDQKMVESISLLRVFGKCFLDEETNRKIDNPDLYNRLSQRFFPYLNFRLPTFEIFTGQNESVVFNNGLPDYSEGTFSGKVYQPNEKENLIEFYQKSMSGRGIVLSATPRHARDLARLIRVLRALNNQLPIQIIIRANFTKQARDIITTAAHESMEAMINSSSDMGFVLPDVDLIEQCKKYNCQYPVQQITFNNIKSLTRERKLFATYNNKLIALAFSSFKEVILMDADTVPLVEIEKFFQSEEYQSTSTYFFKDRSLRDTNDYLETNFFQNLFPLNDDSLDKLFDIPILDKQGENFLNNNYLRGYRHYQEAGVLAIDKSKHYLGILMLLPLGVWKEPVKTSVWGDKELYWIGLLMAGDSNFKFNKYEAASIGEETPETYKMYGATASKEVCSSHPGHVNSAGELLWINSGFVFCKKNGNYRDRDKYPFNKYSPEEMSKIYQSPLRITHALIPPSLPDLRDRHNEINFRREKDLKKSWKLRKPDVDEIKDYEKTGLFSPKIDYNPQKGWVKTSKCTGYYYCAYDQIESYDSTKELDSGDFFAFDEELTRKYDFLGKLWTAGTIKKTPQSLFKAIKTDS